MPCQLVLEANPDSLSPTKLCCDFHRSSRRSMTTARKPSNKTTSQHSGNKNFAYCLEWPLLNSVLRFIDYVFYGIATVPDGPACRAHTVFHRISHDGRNLGGLAESSFNRCGRC